MTFACVCSSGGSWLVQCLTAVPEPELPFVHLTSARSGTSARAPATWSTVCDGHRSYGHVTDRLLGSSVDQVAAQAPNINQTNGLTYSWSTAALTDLNSSPL